MPDFFDVIVIGSGSAASQIASTCRSAGKSVAIIDERPFGGTCALRGCDPKKVLVGAADVVDQARRLRGKGVSGDTRINWRELMRFKRTFTEPVPQQRSESFAKEGIESIHGTARFAAPNRITVGNREFEASAIALACGLRPATLGIPGEEALIDSEQFLNLDELPQRIIFVGGGYIAFEFAHLAVRAGSEVTIIHRGARPLEGFDPDLTNRLVEKTRELGIRIELGTEVDRIAGKTVSSGDKSYEAELIVHAAGRVPNVDSLDLRAGEVSFGKKGVSVDEFLCSVSNSHVYAAGDCADTGTPALTPVAGYEGRIAAANILKPGSTPRAEMTIPSVVFSLPPMARAGMTEHEANSQGLHFETHVADSSKWYSSRRTGEDCSGSKVLTETGTGRILGAHLIGHGCEEVINIFAVAIQNGVTADRMGDTIFAYPTLGSDIPYMLR